jgi:hypothetical protein
MVKVQINLSLCLTKRPAVKTYCGSGGTVLRILLFTTASRTALGPTQPPIQWVPEALSLGVKRPGREADRLPLSGAEVKNACSYTSTPQYAFMAWCSIKITGITLPLPLTIIVMSFVSSSLKVSGTLTKFKHSQ